MRLRTSLTLVVLVGLLVAGSVVGWTLVTEDAPELGGSSDCVNQQVNSKTTLRSDDVRINVYNAGSIDGLASTTMRSLTRRGFVEGVVGNAPARTKAKNVLLLDPQPGSPPVRLVAAQFEGAVDIRRRSDDLSEGVDVLVGNGFRGVDGAAKTSMTVRETTEECVPTDRGS